MTTVRDIAAWYGETFQRDLEQIEALAADALLKVVDFRGIFQFPAVVYLQIGLHHTIHHRGQLSMYLRPMGARVPSIYGESHDATRDTAGRPDALTVNAVGEPCAIGVATTELVAFPNRSPLMFGGPELLPVSGNFK